jgi:hypothetical protein
MCIKIFQHWAIGSISKNPWAITFESLGNCPMALPLATPLFDIINELVIANENQHNPSIVILALNDRIEMQEIISQKIDGRKNTKIICRNSDPISIHDLIKYFITK